MKRKKEETGDVRGRMHSQMSTPLPLGSQTPHWEKRAQWMLTSQIRVALLTTAGMEREEEGEEERRDARGGDRYEEEESRTRIYKIATGTPKRTGWLTRVRTAPSMASLHPALVSPSSTPDADSLSASPRRVPGLCSISM